MPEALKADIRASGRRKGYSGERLDHYTYGTLNKIGAMHGNKTTEKGERTEAGKVASAAARKMKRRR